MSQAFYIEFTLEWVELHDSNTLLLSLIHIYRRYLYVLPTFRWHWFTRPKFSLYTSAGLGAYFLRNSFGGEVFHKTRFAYQFSFLGIEYGSRFAFFTEFGVGYTGTIVAGGRYRF